MAWLAAVVLLCAAAGAACAAPHRAYVVTAKGDVFGYRVRQDGALAPLPGAAAVTRVSGGYPITLRLHPSGRFAYAASIDDQTHKATIWTFRVAEDGSLRLIGARRLKRTLGQLVVHPTGLLLYAVAEENRILPFRIDARTGALSPLPPQDVPTFTIGSVVGGRSEAEMAVHPDGRAAYVFTGTGFVDHSENTLQRYRVAPDGTLREAGEALSTNLESDPRENTGPIRGFSPGGRFAYAEGYGGGVVTYRVRRRDGALTPLLPSARPAPLDATAPGGAEKPEVDGVAPAGRLLFLVGYATEAESAAVGFPESGYPARTVVVCRIGADGRPWQASRTVLRGPGADSWVGLRPAAGGRHLYQIRDVYDRKRKSTDRGLIVVTPVTVDGLLGPQGAALTFPGVRVTDLVFAPAP